MQFLLLMIIEKHNVLAQLPDVSDIQKIGIEYYGPMGEIVKSTKMVQVEHWSFPFVIENPDEIAEIYEYSIQGGSRNTDMMVMFFLEDGRNFSCDLMSTAVDLPECLKKIVNP